MSEVKGSDSISGDALGAFFYQYLQVVSSQNIDALFNFYQTSCLLSSPDKIVLIEDKVKFETEFKEIFDFLNDADLSGIKLLNAGYQVISESVVMVNIGWQFMSSTEQVISEFCAVYHLVKIDGLLKIINVVSQPLDQSLQLPNQLELSH